MTDHKTMYECAVEFVCNLIHETNEQGEKIRRLEAEIRELRAQAEELRFNPNHDPENGRFTSDESGGKGVDISGESGIINTEKDLSNYIGAPIVKGDNLYVRKWYYANVHNIPNVIDKDLPLEQQAEQAYSLRNKYKREARAAMTDFETLNALEKKRPIKSFDKLIESKIERKKMTRDEALRDILETASKTNSEVDELFGL